MCDIEFNTIISLSFEDNVPQGIEFRIVLK